MAFSFSSTCRFSCATVTCRSPTTATTSSGTGAEAAFSSSPPQPAASAANASNRRMSARKVLMAQKSRRERAAGFEYSIEHVQPLPHDDRPVGRGTLDPGAHLLRRDRVERARDAL